MTKILLSIDALVGNLAASYLTATSKDRADPHCKRVQGIFTHLIYQETLVDLSLEQFAPNLDLLVSPILRK